VRSLPVGVTQNFQYIKVVAVDRVGQQDPWSRLDDEELCQAWNEIFGDENGHRISYSGGGRTGEFLLFKQVKTVVSPPFYFLILVLVLFMKIGTVTMIRRSIRRFHLSGRTSLPRLPSPLSSTNMKPELLNRRRIVPSLSRG
jgi:hypothetical protein